MSSFSESQSSGSKPVLITGRIFPTGSCGWSQVRETDEQPGADLSAIVEHSMRPRLVGGLTYSNPDPTLKSLHESAHSLGLSNVANSPSAKKPRAKRGLKGLTSHGRRMVMNAADYLTWRFGHKHCVFGTVTLPSVSKEEAIACTESWPQIVKTFVKNIGRKLHASNLPAWIVSATEIQTSRWKETGVFALHLHFAFVGRCPRRSWALTPVQVRNAWRSAIVSAQPNLSELDYSSCENLQAVRSSIGAYFAKYVSKGSGDLGHACNLEAVVLPPSWYSCTNMLRRLVLRSVRSGLQVGSSLSALPAEGFIWRRRIEIQRSDRSKMTVGWAGQLKVGWDRFFPSAIAPPEDMFLETFPPLKIGVRYHDGFNCTLPDRIVDLLRVPRSVVVTV